MKFNTEKLIEIIDGLDNFKSTDSEIEFKNKEVEFAKKSNNHKLMEEIFFSSHYEQKVKAAQLITEIATGLYNENGVRRLIESIVFKERNGDYLDILNPDTYEPQTDCPNILYSYFKGTDNQKTYIESFSSAIFQNKRHELIRLLNNNTINEEFIEFYRIWLSAACLCYKTFPSLSISRENIDKIDELGGYEHPVFKKYGDRFKNYCKNLLKDDITKESVKHCLTIENDKFDGKDNIIGTTGEFITDTSNYKFQNDNSVKIYFGNLKIANIISLNYGEIIKILIEKGFFDKYKTEYLIPPSTDGDILPRIVFDVIWNKGSLINNVEYFDKKYLFKKVIHALEFKDDDDNDMLFQQVFKIEYHSSFGETYYNGMPFRLIGGSIRLQYAEYAEMTLFIRLRDTNKQEHLLGKIDFEFILDPSGKNRNHDIGHIHRIGNNL